VTPLRELAGNLIMVGLEGPALTKVERAWLRLLRPMGIILFRRNIESVEQSAALLREVTATVGRPMLRCVDLEGGLVDRLRDAIAPMPSPAQVFATGRPELYRKHGQLIGKAAHSAGFNATLAPVLDLALPESAAVMKTRVVAADPAGVVRYASAFLDGLAEQGVVGCGKHFPGLGGGDLDSHHALPVIRRGWQQMWSSDLIPYRELTERLPIVMVSHAAYPVVTRSKAPASISDHWIRNVLRKRVNFRGLVLSDDMEMGGILTQCSMEEAAVRAIAAGTDVIEICHSPALIFSAFEALLREAETSDSFAGQVRAASRRVARWCEQHEITSRGPIRSASSSQLDKLRARIAAFTEECR
jgi:beta-N-acetylhexosaminidase